MAKYIKQEMNDLSGKGEKKVYYRLQTERNIGFDELAREIESRHGMMNRGLVKSVMAIHISPYSDSLSILSSSKYTLYNNRHTNHQE